MSKHEDKRAEQLKCDYNNLENDTSSTTLVHNKLWFKNI